METATPTRPTFAGPADLVVPPDADQVADEVIARLREYGVAYLPGFLPDVAALREDFQRAFDDEADPAEALTDNGKNLSARHGGTDTGRHLKLANDRTLASRFPDTAATFNQELFRDVATRYLGPLFTLSRHVILTHDYIAAEPTLDVHFDELNSLKFFIYLDDIDNVNAPFQAIPGTHTQGKLIRTHEWLRVDDYNQIKNRVFNDFSEEFFYSIFGCFKQLLLTRRVNFTGPAGSLLVFDTDIMHSAGPLAEGRQRRVMRSSTYRGFWP